MSCFCLRAHPCRCIRQDMSEETMQSGDAFCMKASLSYPIFAETASSVTAKVPPKPALIHALELDELNARNIAE